MNKYGTNWKKITKSFPGRSSSAVETRYFAIKKTMKELETKNM